MNTPRELLARARGAVTLLVALAALLTGCSVAEGPDAPALAATKQAVTEAGLVPVPCTGNTKGGCVVDHQDP